jgi:hypothetical protein
MCRQSFSWEAATRKGRIFPIWEPVGGGRWLILGREQWDFIPATSAVSPPSSVLARGVQQVVRSHVLTEALALQTRSPPKSYCNHLGIHLCCFCLTSSFLCHWLGRICEDNSQTFVVFEPLWNFGSFLLSWVAYLNQPKYHFYFYKCIVTSFHYWEFRPFDVF